MLIHLLIKHNNTIIPVTKKNVVIQEKKHSLSKNEILYYIY